MNSIIGYIRDALAKIEALLYNIIIYAITMNTQEKM